MDLAAVRGNPEAFSPAVEVATPFPGARWVCRTVRELIDPDAGARADPGPVRAAHAAAGARRADGPARVRRDRGDLDGQRALGEPHRLGRARVAHHGGFHAAYLVQSLDALVLALAQAAQLSLARLTMLAEPAYTGLHPFLGDGTPAASGVMIVEYSAASALAELRALATPPAPRW